MSRSPVPTSTGQVPTFSQRRRVAQRSGGSVSETKRPPRAQHACASSRSVRRSASSRSSPRNGVVLRSHRDALQAGPSRSAPTSTVPSSASQPRRPPSAAAGLDAHRRAAAPASRARRRPAGRDASSRSSPPPSPSPRATTCRKRTVTVDVAAASLVEQHLRRASTQRVVGMRAVACARREDAAERPAPLVLQRRAPVRPQHVALVQDRVGDRAHGPRHAPPRGSSASSASSQRGQRVARLVGRQPVEAVLAAAAATPCRGSSASIVSFHTRTGSRYSASLSHEMPRRLQRARPRRCRRRCR